MYVSDVYLIHSVSISIYLYVIVIFIIIFHIHIALVFIQAFYLSFSPTVVYRLQ